MADLEQWEIRELAGAWLKTELDIEVDRELVVDASEPIRFKEPGYDEGRPICVWVTGKTPDHDPKVSYFNHHTGDQGFAYLTSSDDWKTQTPEQRRKAAEARLKRIKARQAEERKKYDKAAFDAQTLLRNAEDVPADFPYPARKGVAVSSGVRFTRSAQRPPKDKEPPRQEPAMLVPLTNAKGELRSYQRIFADGFKANMYGAEKVGMFYEFEGQGENASFCIVCEGWATGATLAKTAYGVTVISVCDRGNIDPVCQALVDAGRFTPDRMLICGDNDWATGIKRYLEAEAQGTAEGKTPFDFNPGAQAAKRAAERIGCRWTLAVPDKCAYSDGRVATDANDLYMAKVEDCLASGLDEAEAIRLGEATVKAMLRCGWSSERKKRPEGEQKRASVKEREPDADPMPLHRAAPLQAPYPTDAFGALAGTVKTLADMCFVHESVAGIVVLCSLSLLVQRVFNVKCPGYDFTPTSLYGLSVMESGGGKDMVEGLALRPMKDWERARAPEYEAQMEAYGLEEKTYQKTLKMLEKRFQSAERFDPDQYKAELAELEKSKPLPPVQPVLFSSDLNMEGLFRLLKERTPSHGIMGAEGGILFGGMAFQQENRQRTQGMLCAAWSKGELDKGRMGEGLSKLWNRRVCMDILLQPNVADALFADQSMVTQGFLPRFLITWPEVVGRDLPGIDISSLPEMQSYYRVCKALMNRKPPELDTPGAELVLDDLNLSGDAYGMYRDFYRSLEASIVPGGKYEHVRAYARRGAEQAMRIAGVLTAAWTPECGEVSSEAMNAGVRIASWHLDEILRISLSEAEPPKIKAADSLMLWAATRGIDRISIRQVQQFGPNLIRTKATAEEAIQTLLEHGWLKPAGRGEVWMGDGKTVAARQTFLVVPGYGVQA